MSMEDLPIEMLKKVYTVKDLPKEMLEEVRNVILFLVHKRLKVNLILSADYLHLYLGVQAP